MRTRIYKDGDDWIKEVPGYGFAPTQYLAYSSQADAVASLSLRKDAGGGGVLQHGDPVCWDELMDRSGNRRSTIYW